MHGTPAGIIVWGGVERCRQVRGRRGIRSRNWKGGQEIEIMRIGMPEREKERTSILFLYM